MTDISGRRATETHRGAALYPYYVLIVLMLGLAFSYLDRSVISVVLPQLKLAFHLTDASLGFLSGFAFSVFFVLFGLPVSVVADRKSRRNIIGIAVTLWSVMTALCGAVTNFAELLFLRIGVGIGESGLIPAAYSLLSDLFPPRRRGTVLSLYTLGIHLGIFLGLAGGGYLAQRFGWRLTFVIVGLPGIIIAMLVMLTVKEPKRGNTEKLASEDLEYRKFSEVLRFLWVTRSLRYTVIGTTFCSFVTLGQGVWLPSFLIRSDGMALAHAGLILGIAGGIGGGIGTVLGGWLSDHLSARDLRWRLWVAAMGMAIVPAAGLLFLYTRNVAVIAVSASASAALAAMHKAPADAVTQNLMPPRMRARAVAVTLVLTGLLGGGLGPFLVGVLSDGLHSAFGPGSLRIALTVLLFFAMASALSYFWGGRALPQSAKS